MNHRFLVRRLKVLPHTPHIAHLFSERAALGHIQSIQVTFHTVP